MFLANIQFGKKRYRSKAFYENLIDTYIASLFHNGQLCGEEFYTWTDKVLNAYVCLSHPAAFELKYHSDWGRRELNEVIQAFGHEPKWILLDDDIPKKMPDYKNCPFLYLCTSAYSSEPPIRRGDNGKRISPIMLPIPSKIKDDIYGWERTYQLYEHIWTGCGVLEIPIYKQFADPKSELSDEGRKICSAVEEATGIPTYYYLMRYWGRRNGENQRKCPACGNKWDVEPKEIKNKRFWNFDFQCHECRLVSHKATDYDDERHARIGEYKNNRRSS
jgi:predicted  nucleic acid-binding Zn ribbon protein